MIWVWSIALVATLVVLGVAWRAIARADASVAALRAATEGLGPQRPGSAGLADEVARTRARRTELVERSRALPEP